MTLKFRIETSPGQWLKQADKTSAVMIKAANLALRDVGREAVKEGRGAIASAGFSTQWVNSLRLIMFPRGNAPSLNPVAYIHSTINYSDIFETGKTITGHPFLWMPMPWVPPMLGAGTQFGGVIRRPHMTPSQFVRFVGPLIMMKGAAKPLLGSAVPGKGRLGKQKVRRAGARRKSGMKAKELTVMYVGVRSVTVPKKFDVTGVIERSGAEDNLGAYYLGELEKLKADLE